MKQISYSINKLYLTNSIIIIGILASIIFMFNVQFKVEDLQEEMMSMESQISAYEDEIKLLEVEWVYLTRPERLRILASKYLKDNNYTLASQIKDVNRLEKYYLVNYQKQEEESPQFTLNQASDSQQESGKISF
jgi:hypothetical protein